MEFEATLTGQEWSRALRKLGLRADAARRQEIAAPLTIQVGRAQHSATARIVVQPK